MLQETIHSDVPLYAKIGCMDRETFTSTKLQLHVYTDNQCSQPYDDGQTSRKHATKGFDINGYIFQTHVSFRPAFYTCDSCSPEEISDTFNKANGNWYDDYYISQNGKSNNNNGNDDGYGNDAYQRANDDVPRDDDYQYPNQDYNYNAFVDDAYYNTNDDANNNNNYNNNGGNADDRYNFNDDYYNDDGGRFRHRFLQAKDTIASVAAAAPGQLEVSFQTCLVRLSAVIHWRATECLTLPSFFFFYSALHRLITVSFGAPMMRCKATDHSTKTTMTQVTGTCAKESTNTGYGATKNAAPLTSSARINGQRLTSSFYRSCVHL